MALSNYGELKTTIGNWLHRADLASQIPDFISLAESRIQSDLGDLLALDYAGTLTTVAGTRTYATPTGFVLLRSCVDLRIVLAEEIAQAYADNTAQAEPDCIAWDGTQFVVHPVPDAAYAFPYVAQARFAALSGDSDANTILARWPGLYLYGALAEAAPYLEDDARVQLWAAKYGEVLVGARRFNTPGDVVLRTDLPVTGRRFNIYTGE